MSKSGGMFMKFVLDGIPIIGSSTTHFTADFDSAAAGDNPAFDEVLKEEIPPNPLILGFARDFMMEIDSFSMRAGIYDDRAPDRGLGGTQTKAAVTDPRILSSHLAGATRSPNIAENGVGRDRPRDGGANQNRQGARGTQEEKPTLEESSRPGPFQEWRAGTRRNYPMDLQPSSIKRPVDVSSQVLINACVGNRVFDSASVIKRKPGGGLMAGRVYLRVDFGDVLLTKVDWDGDDDITESIEFIARSVAIYYRPQRSDGTLGAIVPGFWSMDNNISRNILPGNPFSKLR